MDVQRGCLSKQQYFTKAHAKRIARSMTAITRDAFHLYRCPNCRHYHVGHDVPAAVRLAGAAA